ncbi:myosin heavy chain, striated muscle-like [Oscarella lobularis]|uniref:myosin heavy chain, striated muscle-like n=1 Tax=Oscarella lobularis TaxID=121494 RepID=UPI0033135F8C
MADVMESYLRPKEKGGGIGAGGFDSKKWVWVPHDTEGFVAGEVKSRKGNKVTVQLPNGSKEEAAEDDTQQMNPPKFEKVEDMASLTYLNEASVLHNLRQRYYSNLIYTYSGLFCVAVNPYRYFPIYTEKVVQMYKGKRRTEMPPHIFSIADNAYNNMIQDRENQSILITGESGAGKTENTKKVVQYLASVASAAGDKHKGNLEDRVIRCNPLLEAFGNAKTIRNDNSSRFGKFIRIHFGPGGKIAGADIEHYLLEKSRVVRQQKGERCYHFFYQLLDGADETLREKLLLKSTKAADYHFLAGGTAKIDSLNDKEQYKETMEAMDILGVTDDERNFIFKVVAACLHFGNVQVKQPRRGEEAEVSNDTDKVAHLLSMTSPSEFRKGLSRPRMKVGNEWVNKSQNAEKVEYDISALSKLLYERMFRWLVHRINQTLDTKERRSFFIGVLDIAGFEIFDFNSFEQLCINYTNERLQQFFNHHMFILEQEEYRNEGIEWSFIDFGLDLQPCIDLIEKPQGILALLDEECLFPRATDKSFVEKLVSNHDGKSANFSKPAFRSAKGKENAPDFQVAHYAGVVDYNASMWLVKNKDPQNDYVVGMLAKSTNAYIASLFTGYVSAEQAGKKKGGGMFQTVAQLHKASLNNLMTNLRNTHPHFVRCIIPNEQKKAGVIDAHLVLHQLRCNGVLEGIRICRKGFPNRLFFSDFKQRYAILAPTAIPAGFMDGRKAADLLIQELQLEANEFRIGKSKVFFRAGVLGRLEDLRDEKLGRVLTQFQAFCRGFLMRRQYKKLLDQRIGIAVIQRNVRKFMFLKNWSWWKLFTKVKPLLNVARQEDEIRVINEELTKAKDKLTKEETERKAFESKYSEEVEKSQQLFQELQREQDANAVNDEQIEKQKARLADLEQSYEEVSARLEEEEENNLEVSKIKRKVEAELEQLKLELNELQLANEKLDQEKAAKLSQVNALSDVVKEKDQDIQRLNKGVSTLKVSLEERIKAQQAEEDKAKHLGKMKTKLESQLQEVSQARDKEHKLRSDVEKAKRKLEVDFKSLQDNLSEVEQNKAEITEALRKKGDEVTALNQQIEDEQSRIAALEKEIKALKARIEQLEEDLASEQEKRKRVEKQNANLQREMEDLTDRLEEQGGATVVQTELVQKIEADVRRGREDLAKAQQERDSTVAMLKRKHTDAVNALDERIAELEKSKGKLESEKKQLSSQSLSLGGDVENLTRAKTSAEKQCRQLEGHLADANAKIRETEKLLADTRAALEKLQTENTDISNQLEQVESSLGSISKEKSGLVSTVEDLRSQLSDEHSGRLEIQAKYRSAMDKVQTLTEAVDEEEGSKMDLQRSLAKVSSECQDYKSKFDAEQQRVQDLESEKKKLASRISELEEKCETVEGQKKNVEKTKLRLEVEVEDLIIDLEKAQTNGANLEKKHRKFDQQLSEWKAKYDTLSDDFDNSQREARGYSTELMKARSAYDDLQGEFESASKEIKHLKSEIQSLTDQLGEGGKSTHELEKMKKKLESEKEELTAALEEAEGALEQEEGRVLRLQLELAQLKQESDRRVLEKEEEIEAYRKNFARQLEALQETVDQESRAKNELFKQKKRVDMELNELQSQLEGSGKESAGLVKTVKKLQLQCRDLQAMYDDEVKTRETLAESSARSERKCNDLQGEIEDLRASLEQTERARKAAESDRNDLADKVTEQTQRADSMQDSRRKLEQKYNDVQEDLEDRENDLSAMSDKLKKATDQVSRLQSDVSSERESAAAAEHAKASLERQVKDLNERLEEAEANLSKTEKRVVAKLQEKMRSLESQIEEEQKGRQDATKNARKFERKVREVNFQLEEETKASQRLQEQVEKLTSKNRSLRRQFEDADEQVETLKAKIRRLQSELDDVTENYEAAQARLARTAGRSGAASRRAGSNELQ